MQKTPRFIEPLIYRFKSDNLYYPLKTSNIIGGRGRIELVLILPGTLGIREGEKSKILEVFPGWVELSTSAKVYLKELKPIYEKVNEIFTDKSKIYLQMLRYIGRYEFKDDLNLDISNIAPYARKSPDLDSLFGNEIDNLLKDYVFMWIKHLYTPDEIKDYLEAHPELKGKLESFNTYKCIQIKTDFADKKVQHKVVKENFVNFYLKDCLPTDLKIHIENMDITYKQSRRLVENGDIEKNDLFAFECNEPFLLNGNLINKEGFHFSFYRGKISPLITPEYPLYPTLKQIAEKLNLDTPHRIFVIFDGFGGASYEFFCYAEIKPSRDKCQYSFDEILDIHAKEGNKEALKKIAEKYLKRLDYEKAGKAYKKLLELSNRGGLEELLSFYIDIGDFYLAEEILIEQLEKSPNDANLYTSLGEIYLYKGAYEKAESTIHKALKLEFKKGQYKAYNILGEVYTIKKK